MTAPQIAGLDDALPETGSRNWWMLYLGGPLATVSVAYLAFPDLVYDRYIWQYLWGPVVADAAGEPITHDGIRAVKGYNPVNTATYVVILLYSLPGIRALLATFHIDLDTQFAYGLAPILVAGGIMRALEDAGVVPSPFELLFITPPIYVVFAAVTVVMLVVGVSLREWFDAPWAVPLAPAALGTLWSLVGGGVVMARGLRLEGAFRPVVLVAAVGIALTFVGAFYGASRWLGRPAVRHPLVLLLVFGQMLDAAQNLIGVAFFGYTPKLYITKLIYDLTDFAGSTFLLKVGAVVLITWIVTTSEEPVAETWNWLILFATTAVGLPQGVRGMVRIALGV